MRIDFQSDAAGKRRAGPSAEMTCFESGFGSNDCEPCAQGTGGDKLPQRSRSFGGYSASIVEIPMVTSSSTSNSMRTVSSEVSITTLFWAAILRSATPSP